jgi:hypothetical protein
LYDNNDFKGESREVKEGTYDCGRFGRDIKFGDRTQSLKVADGYEVEVWQHCWTGRSMKYRGEVRRTELQNEISSMKVYKVDNNDSPVTLYDNTDFKGESV